MTVDLLLAIETSSRRGSVALCSGDGVVRESVLHTDRTHTAELLPAIRDLLVSASASPRDVGVVAFSQGPGSFTGLRVAATLARTWRSSTGCRVVAVDTLEVIARRAMRVAPARVGVVVDARQDRVFFCAFARGNGGSPIADRERIAHRERTASGKETAGREPGSGIAGAESELRTPTAREGPSALRTPTAREGPVQGPTAREGAWVSERDPSSSALPCGRACDGPLPGGRGSEAVRAAGDVAAGDAVERRLDALLAELPRDLVLTGDALARHGAAFAAAGFSMLPETWWLPSAVDVAAIGRERASAGLFCTPEEITPRYIRAPECEEVYEKRRSAAIARREGRVQGLTE